MPQSEAIVSEAKPDTNAPAGEIGGLKDFPVFSQDSVNYTTLSQVDNQACANCVFYRPAGYGWEGFDKQHCHLIESWPKSIEPTGLCDRWEAAPEPDLMGSPMPVVIVDVEVETDDEDKAAVGGGIVKTIKGVIDNILNPKTHAFQVFKTKDGKMLWIARHTGKFVDREKEILADKSHAAYVERVQKGLVDMPELWTWHKEGTRHGEAAFVWKSGGFTLALGTIDDTDEGRRAFEFYQKNAGKITLSHMFFYPLEAKQNGVYYAYNTREITTLPDGAEAFPYTTFDSFEESNAMALTDVQRNFIRELGGDEMVKRAEAADAKAVKDTEALEAKGVASKGAKGYEDFSGSEIPGGDALKALNIAQKDMDARLKSAEKAVEAVEGLKTTIADQNKRIEQLAEQLTAAQRGEAEALKQVNDLQLKWAEFAALKPPASKAQDTLLADREKETLVEAIAEAQRQATPTLVDQMAGGQPTVSTQSDNGG